MEKSILGSTKDMLESSLTAVRDEHSLLQDTQAKVIQALTEAQKQVRDAQESLKTTQNAYDKALQESAVLKKQVIDVEMRQSAVFDERLVEARQSLQDVQARWQTLHKRLMTKDLVCSTIPNAAPARPTLSNLDVGLFFKDSRGGSSCHCYLSRSQSCTSKADG